MGHNEERGVQGYGVQCGDGTGGRVAAGSPEGAAEMAAEMCQIHGGEQGQPQRQPQPQPQEQGPLDTVDLMAQQIENTCEDRPM